MADWADVPVAVAKNAGFCFWYDREPATGTYAVPGCPDADADFNIVSARAGTNQKYLGRGTAGLGDGAMWGIGGYHEFAGTRRNPGWLIVWLELDGGPPAVAINRSRAPVLAFRQ